MIVIDIRVVKLMLIKGGESSKSLKDKEKTKSKKEDSMKILIEKEMFFVVGGDDNPCHNELGYPDSAASNAAMLLQIAYGWVRDFIYVNFLNACQNQLDYMQ